VGLSVNIKDVLSIEEKGGAPLLTGRGLEALIDLLNVLVICIIGATPNISRGVLAAFIPIIAAESAISPVRAVLATRGRSEISKSTLQRLMTAFALTLVYVITGITLAVEHGGGLLWLPAAFVLSIFIAALNARISDALTCSRWTTPIGSHRY
jgi:phosphatidylglycerophosphate synthase